MKTVKDAIAQSKWIEAVEFQDAHAARVTAKQRFWMIFTTDGGVKMIEFDKNDVGSVLGALATAMELTTSHRLSIVKALGIV